MTTTPEPGSVQSDREDSLTAAVLASFEDTPDARVKQLMQALVRHLHSYLREVRLSEAEWNAAIGFLTAAGHITTDRRQEFVLLSDVLGASMMTVAMNNGVYGNATEATVFGPFFVNDAPLVDLGGDIAGDAPGEPCWVEGTVSDTTGALIPDARLEVWEADEDGLYDVQYDDGRVAGRAHLFTDQNGQYRFWGLTPTPYPIPDDGPVGAMLSKSNRSPYRASHLHFMVSAPGYRTVVTHIFVAGDALLDRDSVFGVKPSLVMDFAQMPPHSPTPDGRELHGRPWSRTRFDIALAPDPVDRRIV